MERMNERVLRSTTHSATLYANVSPFFVAVSIHFFSISLPHSFVSSLFLSHYSISIPLSSLLFLLPSLSLFTSSLSTHFNHTAQTTQFFRYKNRCAYLHFSSLFCPILAWEIASFVSLLHVCGGISMVHQYRSNAHFSSLSKAYSLDIFFFPPENETKHKPDRNKHIFWIMENAKLFPPAKECGTKKDVSEQMRGKAATATKEATPKRSESSTFSWLHYNNWRQRAATMRKVYTYSGIVSGTWFLCSCSFFSVALQYAK